MAAAALRCVAIPEEFTETELPEAPNGFVWQI
jgi:hypothetical protein